MIVSDASAGRQFISRATIKLMNPSDLYVVQPFPEEARKRLSFFKYCRSGRRNIKKFADHSILRYKFRTKPLPPYCFKFLRRHEHQARMFFEMVGKEGRGCGASINVLWEICLSQLALLVYSTSHSLVPHFTTRIHLYSCNT
ncbi:hypothetical protein M378DRAFT_958970 [Amanita muscaria Koide BX008]|uniref:Uncharacterized protein n=1 Tax=Amanita muscaria (strain Koide BX008) TaxID=946122 RepID=A0A0C2WT95_AMAMK|nr:hypothetical protein M378DRAFT_958970 [Amanita muscaria Koide BX008]